VCFVRVEAPSNVETGTDAGPEVWLARADRLYADGRAEAALTCYRRAADAGADPDQRIAERWRCAMATGDFATAWREGDRVLELRRFQSCEDRQIWERWLWNGHPLEGRRVLVRCWRGLGDTIQFARYLPHLAAHAQSVACELHPTLIALFAASIPSIPTWVALGDDSPEHDAAIESTELAHYFRTVPATIPAAPYLFAAPDEERTASRKRVGLVWRGGDWDQRRALDFASLRPLLDLPGIEFVALQRGIDRDETATHGLTLVEEGDALATARLIASLDLVITIDSMMAHLAGALGVPVWTLLHAAPDWRWFEAREDSPWYGSMRLFRQRHAGQWGDVVLRVRGQLQRWSESAETGPRNWRSTMSSHAAP
jgi:hypothetical protein